MDFLHLFRAGGFMMYPLILCSLVVVAIFIERFRYYRSNRSHVDQLSQDIPKYLEKRDYEGLKTLLQQDGGIPASVVLAGVEHMNLKVDQTSLIEGAASHAAGLLKNYLNYLDVIVTLSPLMGLLGTVIGMIGSFNVLSVSNGQPFAVTAVWQKPWYARPPAFLWLSLPSSPIPIFPSR